MPTLEWIGKDNVLNHHQEVPSRVLERRYSSSKKRKTGTAFYDSAHISRSEIYQSLNNITRLYVEI